MWARRSIMVAAAWVNDAGLNDRLRGKTALMASGKPFRPSTTGVSRGRTAKVGSGLDASDEGGVALACAYAPALQQVSAQINNCPAHRGPNTYLWSDARDLSISAFLQPE